MAQRRGLRSAMGRFPKPLAGGSNPSGRTSVIWPGMSPAFLSAGLLGGGA